MARISFSQVLKNAAIDIRREYDRLYSLFCLQRIMLGNGMETTTLRDTCAMNFANLPFRGTCISLDDFDDSYERHYERKPSAFDIDYLVSFCEYSYNLAVYNQGIGYGGLQMNSTGNAMQFYINQVQRVIESIGYMPNAQNGIVDFVPKDQAAISVAEIIDPSLSYRVIEYNHYSMKGDLKRKRDILLAIEDKLEPQRDKLKQINATMESDLFFLFNSVNLRHNNADPDGKNYIPFVANMMDEEIEKWYDEAYQICLLAFLELDNVERKNRVNQLKKDTKAKQN